MNLIFATKQDAQIRVDKIHADLIATNPLYAESAALYISSGGKAGTARWDFPKQDVDKDGKVVGTDWKVTVDTRARPVLTKVETESIAEWKVVAVAEVKII